MSDDSSDKKPEVQAEFREPERRIIMPHKVSARKTSIQLVDRITSTEVVMGDIDVILASEVEKIRIKSTHMGLLDEDMKRLEQLSKILKTQEDIKMSRMKSKELNDELAALSDEELIKKLSSK